MARRVAGGSRRRRQGGPSRRFLRAGRGLRHPGDRRDEAIAAPRYCSEVAVLSGCLLQDAAQCRDDLRESALLNHQPGPQLGQEPFLVQQLARMLDEEQEGFQNLGFDRQRNRPALRKQQVPPCIEPEVAEFVQEMRLRCALRVHGNSEEFGRIRPRTKDFWRSLENSTRRDRQPRKAAGAAAKRHW